MLVNVLRFSFKDGTTEEDKAKVLAAMRRTATLESTSFSTVGQFLGDPAEGFTHAYCAGVTDLAALDRYLHDPAHIAGDDEILPHLAKLSAFQLSDDMDPALGEKVMGMHLKKVAMYPEWGQALDAISGLGGASGSSSAG
ncbi:Dabb family protein [Streptomyces sp. NPDC044780]|uniref:Dabb family protein n=1 Tax=Streptomyces luomodiensis TaxID=3026192 RepID=A0ABY9V6K6_9ACTN|nr:Dabb family protein [Streptomyces sp. SCA4-21]WNF00520.1 Dabb family protein [Streptomyces sp. SCA4-21]